MTWQIWINVSKQICLYYGTCLENYCPIKFRRRPVINAKCHWFSCCLPTVLYRPRYLLGVQTLFYCCVYDLRIRIVALMYFYICHLSITAYCRKNKFILVECYLPGFTTPHRWTQWSVDHFKRDVVRLGQIHLHSDWPASSRACVRHIDRWRYL